MATAVLTEAEKQHFIKHGWLKIPQAFTAERAAEMTENVWTRLGMLPTDKSTWTQERIHMPSHRHFDCATFAPRAWAAICELCGGAERVAEWSRQWHDALIVNLGTAEAASEEGPWLPPQTLTGWHVDGDFFVHYLDSPEQALLVIPLFSDIPPGGGGTMLCPAAVPQVARWLHDHPEGVSPRMVPRGQPGFGTSANEPWFAGLASRCASDEGGSKSDRGDAFVEATGAVGDVYLMHPLMLHSASTNPLRNVRVITNPPVSLRTPFCFNRPDGAYTPIEQATLSALGVPSLPGWSITAARESVVPERLMAQARMKEQELQRLQKEVQ